MTAERRRDSPSGRPAGRALTPQTPGRDDRPAGRALTPPTPGRDVAVVALLVAMKLVVDACVIRAGFSHVSDDDYARTVIAQQFAHAPRLDPSGTSWLPLPFWIAGAWMGAVGRSLGASRTIAVVLGALGVVAPYAAMRAARVPRAAAAGATLIAMALPWSAWLGVATVPDGWTGALIAAGAIALHEDRARPWAAAALCVASLSRYEAWPACAVLALFCALRIAGDLPAPARRREAACAIVALAGPALWMAWNAHAHGSALHFVARVTAFRRSVGAADVPWSSKLLGYPRALLDETPEAAALGACGVIALIGARSCAGGGDGRWRRRSPLSSSWWWATWGTARRRTTPRARSVPSGGSSSGWASTRSASR